MSFVPIDSESQTSKVCPPIELFPADVLTSKRIPEALADPAALKLTYVLAIPA
jgi:hypothetical protein